MLQIERFLSEKGELLFEGLLILRSEGNRCAANGINLLYACACIPFHFLDLMDQLPNCNRMKRFERNGVGVLLNEFGHLDLKRSK